MRYVMPSIFVMVICSMGCQVQSKVADKNFLIGYNVAMDKEQTDYDVWIIDPQTLGKKNVTNHKDVAWTYVAGNKIILISDRDTCTRCYFLYEMDADGSGLKKITEFQLADSWMGFRNNETEMIVSPHSSVDTAFYIINKDGVVTQKITPALPYFSDPVFSPSGRQVAFRGAMKSSKKEIGFEEAIYVMNTDGSALKKISTYPEMDTSAPWFAYKAGPPRWHPSGNFITYQSMQNGKYSLYAVTPDGNRQWKLTDNSQEEGWHDWSRDGNWLAIELFNKAQTQFHIGLMNWQTKDLQILTDTAYAFQQAPVFIYPGN